MALLDIPNVKKEPTRYHSTRQENKVAKAFDGKRTLNSGATMFQKGDILLEDFLIECKTKVTDSQSISIKKDWIEKNEKEALFMGKPFSALAISFGPNSKNYYVISEELMDILTKKVREDA